MLKKLYQTSVKALATSNIGTWGIIDDQSIAVARELMNTPLRRDRMQWVKTATRDAISQFARGVGDDNPLWHDLDYAKKTRWKGLIAPPSFLYAVDATIVAPKLPGVQWIYAGTKWKWLDVIAQNETFDVSAKLVSMEEKTGRTFKRWIMQIGEIKYYNEAGGLLSVAEGRVARTPRAQERKQKKTTNTPKEKTAKQTFEQTSINKRRGDQPRLWENIEVGELVGPDLHSLTLTDIYGWYVGAQGALHYGGAHADAVRYRHRHDDFSINTKTGAKDSAARGHFSEGEGNKVGMGGAYDVGLHRISWIVALVTNWMGDDGFLAELDVSILKPNLVGDLTNISGYVSKIWEDSHCFLRIEIEAENQNKQITAAGYAVVALPSERKGAVQLPLFNGNVERFNDFPSIN